MVTTITGWISNHRRLFSIMGVLYTILVSDEELAILKEILTNGSDESSPEYPSFNHGPDASPVTALIDPAINEI
jgi:hypothetical protein